MQRFVLVLAALGLLATAMPAQGAVHGVDWVATGVATQGDQTLLIEVKWDGCLGCFYGTYTVKLTDPESLAVVEQRSFFGYLQQTAAYIGPYCFCWEVLSLNGADLVTSVTFQVSAYQAAGIGNGPHLLNQVVMGSYQGWSFTGVTAVQVWQNN